MGQVSGMEISSPPKISQWEEKLAVGPWVASFFFPRANFKVKFPCLKPTAHSDVVFL